MQIPLKDFLEILIRHREWSCVGKELADKIKAEPDYEKYAYIEAIIQTPHKIQEEQEDTDSISSTRDKVFKVWYLSAWRTSSERHARAQERQKEDNLAASELNLKLMKLRAVLAKQCGDNKEMAELLARTMVNNPALVKQLYGIDL